MTDIAVLDYGSGNIRSAVRALEAAGAQVELTRDPATALAASGLLVPGVGAFAAVMDGLNAVGAEDVIRQRHQSGRPTLGICVGEQVLFTSGTEHGLTVPGIGLWPGSVTKLDAPVTPHMGWSEIQPPSGSRMFAGLEKERFYFVHSYAAHEPVPGALTTFAEHGQRFVAAVEDGTTWATQFHPEKSGAAGLRLLRQWCEFVAHTAAPA